MGQSISGPWFVWAKPLETFFQTDSHVGDPKLEIRLGTKLGICTISEAPDHDSVQLVPITPMTMVYGITIVNEVYKPTNITGGGHIVGIWMRRKFFVGFRKRGKPLQKSI